MTFLNLAGGQIQAVGGHAVHVIGYTKAASVPWILHIHDATQGNNNHGTSIEENGVVAGCLTLDANANLFLMNTIPAGFPAVVTNLLTETP
jgi:hypothetical protein